MTAAAVTDSDTAEALNDQTESPASCVIQTGSVSSCHSLALSVLIKMY